MPFEHPLTWQTGIESSNVPILATNATLCQLRHPELENVKHTLYNKSHNFPVMYTMLIVKRKITAVFTTET